MTALAITLAIVCQLFLVAGQILLKKGMDPDTSAASHWTRQVPMLGAGIMLLTLWFFLWLGLLKEWDLSTLFPFEALSQVLLAFAAWAVLKEKLTPSGWAGILLVSVGVALVARG